MLIHISHDTAPAPWFFRSKREVLDSAFFVISIAPASDYCLASPGDNLFAMVLLSNVLNFQVRCTFGNVR